MGFKDFWNRVTGGDKLERVEEEFEADPSLAEEPERVEDYVGMKDDVALKERFGGPIDSDR